MTIPAPNSPDPQASERNDAPRSRPEHTRRRHRNRNRATHHRVSSTRGATIAHTTTENDCGRALMQVGRLAGDSGEKELTYGTSDEAVQHDSLRCASFAVPGVLAYAERVHAHHEDIRLVLSHLMCDLMHLTDVLGRDFTGVLAAARIQYSGERRGQWNPQDLTAGAAETDWLSALTTSLGQPFPETIISL
jgi:hypothetical protein